MVSINADRVGRPGIGCLAPIVCLLVFQQHNSNPKVFTLGVGNDLGKLGCPRNHVVLRLKDQGSGHRVNKCIFHTNEYYAYVNAHLTNNSNTAWVQTL